MPCASSKRLPSSKSRRPPNRTQPRQHSRKHQRRPLPFSPLLASLPAALVIAGLLVVAALLLR